MTEDAVCHHSLNPQAEGLTAIGRRAIEQWAFD
jgi:hypothetical protein